MSEMYVAIGPPLRRRCGRRGSVSRALTCQRRLVTTSRRLRVSPCQGQAGLDGFLDDAGSVLASLLPTDDKVSSLDVSASPTS